MFTFIFAHIFKRVPESLALASSLSFLGLEATCPRQLGPWPWTRTFSESLTLASKVVSSPPPLSGRVCVLYLGRLLVQLFYVN